METLLMRICIDRCIVLILLNWNNYGLSSCFHRSTNFAHKYKKNEYFLIFLTRLLCCLLAGRLRTLKVRNSNSLILIEELSMIKLWMGLILMRRIEKAKILVSIKCKIHKNESLEKAFLWSQEDDNFVRITGFGLYNSKNNYFRFCFLCLGSPFLYKKDWVIFE